MSTTVTANRAHGRLDPVGTETAGGSELAHGRAQPPLHRASRKPERFFVGVIDVENLSHIYQLPSGEPVRALHEVSLSISAGEYVAIIGRNGSGKSTLAQHFNALLLPTEGTVRVDGIDTRDLARRRDVRRRVAMVFQDPDNQIVATVVEEDVAFGPENLGVPPPEIRRRVDEALQLVGLSEHGGRAPHLLSVGQRQRLAVAGAIAMAPGYLVLDEATAMLDPGARRRVLDIARRLHGAGMTIINITHFMREAVEATRIIVLDGGQVALDGTPADVFGQPERLRSLGLDLPPVAQIARQLHAIDPSVPAAALTSDDLVAAVVRVTDGGMQGNKYTGRGHEYEPMDGLLADAAGTAALATDRDSAAVVVDGLAHTYAPGTPQEIQALRGVDLTVGRDEIVGLIGPTGSGKSTLLQHFNGLLLPQTGSVRVNGMEVGAHGVDIRKLRSQVGLLFQQPEDQLFERYVGDDIAFGPQAQGLSLEGQRARVQWAMAAVGLDFTAFKDRLTFTLSGGERRKVALAGVLALQPSLLVLDEPTAGLDPASHEEFLELLLRFHHAERVAVVIATHNMDDIARLADRVYVLADGCVVAHGTPREVFARSELLAAHELAAPAPVEVAGQLRSRGLKVRADALTVSEVVADVGWLLKGRHEPVPGSEEEVCL
jgi:energy-coupling factor transporter ATPase